MKKQILLLIYLMLSINVIGFCQSSVDKLNSKKYSTDSINGIYIPKDLDDCFIQIDVFWNDSIKNQVKLWTEEEFCANTHFGIGLWMRNNWGLWGESRLQAYFNDKGIYHADDMSGIILTSYYRYLTNREIELKKQIKYYKAYWENNNTSEVSILFEAKTFNNSTYTSIDTALLYSDRIADISLTGYKKLPKKLKQFKNLSKITIENCPELDFQKAFKSLSNYQNLSELYLFSNSKYEYPSNLGDLTKLNKLWISGDSLSVLPNEIKMIDSLNELIITECPIINLNTLFELLVDIKTLRELDLSENDLTEIPFSISNIIQLTDLWLDENQLSKIPDGVKSLPNLDYLGLFSNNLKSLNLVFGDLPNLTNINLCYNSFEKFPMELENLKKLKNVTMWNSEISIIPEEITKLKGLKNLNLSGNNLTEEQKNKLKVQLPETKLEL